MFRHRATYLTQRIGRIPHAADTILAGLAAEMAPPAVATPPAEPLPSSVVL